MILFASTFCFRDKFSLPGKRTKVETLTNKAPCEWMQSTAAAGSDASSSQKFLLFSGGPVFSGRSLYLFIF
jgi:hypothetical protein